MIYNAPVRDMIFLVDEWIGLENISSLPGHEELDRDVLQFILEKAGKFCSAASRDSKSDSPFTHTSVSSLFSSRSETISKSR